MKQVKVVLIFVLSLAYVLGFCIFPQTVQAKIKFPNYMIENGEKIEGDSGRTYLLNYKSKFSSGVIYYEPNSRNYTVINFSVITPGNYQQMTTLMWKNNSKYAYSFTYKEDEYYYDNFSYKILAAANLENEIKVGKYNYICENYYKLNISKYKGLADSSLVLSSFEILDKKGFGAISSNNQKVYNNVKNNEILLALYTLDMKILKPAGYSLKDIGFSNSKLIRKCGNDFLKSLDTSNSDNVKEEGIIFPDSSSKLIPINKLRKLSDSDLRLAINEIYARHGYIFHNKDLLNYYRKFDWYTENVYSDDFSFDDFNVIEQKNLKRMIRERDLRKEK